MIINNLLIAEVNVALIEQFQDEAIALAVAREIEVLPHVVDADVFCLKSGYAVAATINANNTSEQGFKIVLQLIDDTAKRIIPVETE